MSASADDESAGSVYLFEEVEGFWTETLKLRGDDVRPRSRFGSSLALVGNRLFVGAVEQGTSQEFGGVYDFLLQDGRWAQERKIVASDAIPRSLFGLAVTARPENLVVGAPLDDSAGSDAGAAYAYDSTRNAPRIVLLGPEDLSQVQAGNRVILTWTASEARVSDRIRIWMQRDAAWLDEPVGVNRVLLVESTANDGVEEITILDGLAGAADWRFLIEHLASGAFDSSDVKLTVIAQPTPEPCEVGNGLCFYTLLPCRLIDTRGDADGPALQSSVERTLLTAGRCGVPPTAQAIAANVTVTEGSGAGHLQIYPEAGKPSQTSSINFDVRQTDSCQQCHHLPGQRSGRCLEDQSLRYWTRKCARHYGREWLFRVIEVRVGIPAPGVRRRLAPSPAGGAFVAAQRCRRSRCVVP